MGHMGGLAMRCITGLMVNDWTSVNCSESKVRMWGHYFLSAYRMGDQHRWVTWEAWR